MNAQRVISGVLAVVIASGIIRFGDKLLGVQIELFHGLDTFNFRWAMAIFVVPLIAGFVVSLVFGLGGKWLCYFPPLIVRAVAYYETAYLIEIPEGASLLPLGWWGFFVILCIEAAAIGGVFGEIALKRTYGRLPRHLVYKGKPDERSSKPES